MKWQRIITNVTCISSFSLLKIHNSQHKALFSFQWKHKSILLRQDINFQVFCVVNFNTFVLSLFQTFEKKERKKNNQKMCRGNMPKYLLTASTLLLLPNRLSSSNDHRWQSNEFYYKSIFFSFFSLTFFCYQIHTLSSCFASVWTEENRFSLTRRRKVFQFISSNFSHLSACIINTVIELFLI